MIWGPGGCLVDHVNLLVKKKGGADLRKKGVCIFMEGNGKTQEGKDRKYKGKEKMGIKVLGLQGEIMGMGEGGRGEEGELERETKRVVCPSECRKRSNVNSRSGGKWKSKAKSGSGSRSPQFSHHTNREEDGSLPSLPPFLMF